MGKTATAFSPGHITGFFQICDGPVDPLLRGSRGAGLSISRGVKTRVNVKKSSKTSIKIRINGHKVSSACVSERVVHSFLSYISPNGNYEVLVEHQVDIPIGAGFGSSGAGALSLALALNEVFHTDLSKIEVAQIAHAAEVKCKTGLGTVIAETFGGIEIRTKPGAPGIGEIKHIPIKNNYVVVCLCFGPLPTGKFLSDKEIRRRIIEFGGKLTDELAENPNIDKFMEFSRKFAENVGLITGKLRKVLDETDAVGLVCSMPMFGESIFSLIKQEFIEDLLKIFRNHASRGRGSIIISEIDFKGARLLDE